MTYQLSSVGAQWTDAQALGAARWNVTTDVPDIVATNSGLANVWVYDDVYTATWAGLHSGYCPWGNYIWDPHQTRIQYNLSTSSGFPHTASNRLAVAVHEIGHAWGLGHTPYSCVTRSVMNSWAGYVNDTCPNPGTPPYPDDIAGKNFLY